MRNRTVGTPRETEADLQQKVIGLARLLGYRVAHFRAARTSHGWRTPVAADGAGFPDLVLARPGRLLFVELKAGRGRVAPEQRVWLDMLAAAGAEVHVWRPDDAHNGTIVDVLRRAA